MAEKENLQEVKQLLLDIQTLQRRLGREQLNISTNEASKNINTLKQLLDSLRKDIDNMGGSFGDLYGTLKGITSEIKGQNSAINKARQSFRKITSITEKLRNDELQISELNEKELKSLEEQIKLEQQRAKDSADQILEQERIDKKVQDILNKQIEQGKFEKGSIEAKKAQFAIIQRELGTREDISEEAKAVVLAAYDYNAAGEEGLNIYEELLEKTKERLKEEERIADSAAGGYQSLSKVVKSIPGLSGLSGPFEKAAEASAKAEKAKPGSGFAAGAEVLKESAVGALTSFTGLVGIFNIFKNILFEVSGQVTEFSKSMNVSSTEAQAFREELQAAAMASGDITKTTKGLAKSFGELQKSAGVTRGFTMDQIKLQSTLVKKVGLQSDDAAKLVELGRINGLTQNEVLSSITSQTNALFEQEAIQLDNRDILSEVAQINGQLAANYANNPQAIAKAVVATRRLGLSLSAAKDATEGLLDFEESITSEVQAELLLGRELNLDRARGLALQGKSAEAAEELAKNFGTLKDFQSLNVLQQNALAKSMGMTSDELANVLLQQENLNKLSDGTKRKIQERANELRAEGKVAEANALLSRATNEEQANAQLMQLDAQQKFNAALDKAKDVFVSLIDSLPVLASVLGGIAAILGVMAVKAIITSVGLTGGLAAIGIGAALAGFGITRAMASSNKAEPVTVADKKETATGVSKFEDFEIRALPQDTIVTQGGTKLGRTEEMVKELRENNRLLKALHDKEGRVTMDSVRVGSALTLSSYKNG